LPNNFASEGGTRPSPTFRRGVRTTTRPCFKNNSILSKEETPHPALESSERLRRCNSKPREQFKPNRNHRPDEGVVRPASKAELNTFVARGQRGYVDDGRHVRKSRSPRNSATDQLYWVLNQKKADQNTPGTDRGRPAGVSTQDRGYRLPPTPVIVRYVVTGREVWRIQWVGQPRRIRLASDFDEQTRTVPFASSSMDPRAFAVGSAKERSSSRWKENAENVGPTTLVRGMFVSLRLELTDRRLVVLPSEALNRATPCLQFQTQPGIWKNPSRTVLASKKGMREHSREEKRRGESKRHSRTRHPPSQRKKIIAKTDEPSDTASGRSNYARSMPPPGVPGNLLILSKTYRPVDRFITTEQSHHRRGPAKRTSAGNRRGIRSILDFARVPRRVASQFGVVRPSFLPVAAYRTDAFPVVLPASV